MFLLDLLRTFSSYIFSIFRAIYFLVLKKLVLCSNLSYRRGQDIICPDCSSSRYDAVSAALKRQIVFNLRQKVSGRDVEPPD